MKKTLVLLAAVIAFASCASGVKLINTSTTKEISLQPVAGLFADIEVAPNRITYSMMPSESVKLGGYDNVVSSAVREALDANGGWDLLVALETQVKYASDGQIESIIVTGYPAKYVNFRNPGDDYLKTIPVTTPAGAEKKPAISLPFKNKRG